MKLKPFWSSERKPSDSVVVVKRCGIVAWSTEFRKDGACVWLRFADKITEIYIYTYCTLKGGKLALQAFRYYQEIHPASDQISPVFILPQSNMLHLNKTIIYLRLNYQMETWLDGYGPTPVPWFWHQTTGSFMDVHSPICSDNQWESDVLTDPSPW